MNWTQIEGKWEQLKGDAKSRWARLTDDDLRFVGGRFEHLVGKVVERYGVRKDQAHEQVSEWADRLGARIDAAVHSLDKGHAEDGEEEHERKPHRH
jgi:uncharacterized protein YjbJ (UPF0337 family)